MRFGKQIWTWYYARASIRTKLVISYLILVLLPIFGLGIYAYHISTQNLLEQTRQTMEGNISSIVYSLNRNIERENDNIKYLSYNTSFREKLQDADENAVKLAKELTESVEPVFWYFITSDDNIKGIKIYSPYVKQGIGSFLKALEQEEEKEWYEQNKNNFKTQWFYKEERIYVTRILLDADSSSEPIGMMSLEVYPQNFIEGIYQAEFLKNGVLLLDQNKVCVAKKEMENKELEDLMVQTISAGMKAGFYETPSYMLFVSEELSNGWQISYYVDKEEISEQMETILISTATIMIVCLVIVTVLINFISKLLSSRILKLEQLAEQVSSGNFAVEFATDSTDEIGTVEKSFVKMSRRIQDMMEEMYQLGLEKRAEELKALQAMIHPHFLYNCLSSIKWKAIRAEQDDIADITGLVAKFYRTALNGGKQITTVENELENIKSYLQIQMRTHEYPFEVQYVLEEHGLQYEMPNFLLQPIVENAIRHGVEYCQENMHGLIRIEYRCEEQYLLFHILNNGSDVDEESLEKILETPGNGYGLYNIRERIRMYYKDEKCGLFVKVTDGGLVCFTVCLNKKCS